MADWLSARLFSVIDFAGTPIGVLARRAGVTKQAMSQVVDDLVRKGYVERHEDPADRRSRIVFETLCRLLSEIQPPTS
jgi:DNA-binding MarR family transcriptional regulator